MTSRISLRRRVAYGAAGASVLAMVATAGGAGATPLDGVESATAGPDDATEVIQGIEEQLPVPPVTTPDAEAPSDPPADDGVVIADPAGPVEQPSAPDNDAGNGNQAGGGGSGTGGSNGGGGSTSGGTGGGFVDLQPGAATGGSGGGGGGAAAGPPPPLAAGGGAAASATIVAAAVGAAPVPLDAGLNAALSGSGIALSPSLPGLSDFAGFPVGELMGGSGSALAPLLAGSLPDGATLPNGRDPLMAPFPAGFRSLSMPIPTGDPAVPVALLVVAVMATGALAAGHITVLQRGGTPAAA